MKRLENTEENRRKQCEKEIQIILHDLENPENFEKNKIAEEALSAVIIKEEE